MKVAFLALLEKHFKKRSFVYGDKGIRAVDCLAKGYGSTVEVYRLAKLLPQEELYALSDQMRRAAVSLPSNIAEGQSRGSTKEFIQFLNFAAASNAELFTQLLICERVGYISPEQLKNAKNLSSEISRMLSTLLIKLNSIK